MCVLMCVTPCVCVGTSCGWLRVCGACVMVVGSVESEEPSGFRPHIRPHRIRIGIRIRIVAWRGGAELGRPDVATL